ncbi:MAG TPA: methionine biosynthesis protein MetW, partial [Oxalicibacterium sp.]|nr:methionine biosynthesis protein MetW [Oxalicibacterium sp.]
TVLCLSALQMMKNVEGVLRDIARVGREAIVSFPNFAYWPHRVALLRGHMPVSKSLPYDWYDTPNLRCATINDFSALANEVGLQVIECVALDDGHPVSFLPNWRGSLAVFRLRKNKSQGCCATGTTFAASHSSAITGTPSSAVPVKKLA